MVLLSISSFLLTALKVAILICMGIIIRDHFETLISMIIRRHIPENLISEENYGKFTNILRIVGTLIILLGVAMIVFSLITLASGIAMGSAGSFSLKF